MTMILDRNQDEPGSPSSPSTSGGTGVLERTETEQQKAPGDNERYAHFVRKDKMGASTGSGAAVVALCGKVWVPLRDPKRFPVCPTCKAILEGMKNNGQNWPFNSDQGNQG